MKTDKKILQDTCESFLDMAIELYDVPGIAIGVSAGEFQFTGARGYRNYITGDMLNSDAIFHCGSVSKLFTSTGIMKLVENGSLCLDDKLSDLLPYLSIADKRYTDIKLYHLLSHTSGMGDTTDYHWEKERMDEKALKDYALSDEVIKTPMLWEAGKGEFRYSNIAYELLGLIIAEKSKQLYEDYIADNFLRPLGMTDSTFLTFQRTEGSLSLDDIDKTNMAMPHEKGQDNSIVLVKHYPYNREHAPSSTLTSNVGDLLKWAKANMSRTVLARETYDWVWKEYATVTNNGEKMGLGWFMREQEGYKLFGHEGTDDGFRASLWFCTDLDLAIAVLSNMSKAPVKKLNKKLFSRIMPLL